LTEAKRLGYRPALTSGLDEVEKGLLKGQIEEVIEILPPREKRILELSFGLLGERALTHEEIGRRFGVTRGRIRQIQAKALRKLRHPARSKELRDYLG
jgi:RNA polymerase primary sigma factor